MNHKPWRSIFDAYNIHEHNFDNSPFILTAEQIKRATSHFTSTTEFFEKRKQEYLLWQFGFKDIMNYNSIELLRSAKFEIH